MQLLRTVTPKGTRYYIDGRRVSGARYEETRNAPRVSESCFRTVISGANIRHFQVVTLWRHNHLTP